MMTALKLLMAIGISLGFLSPAFGEESSSYSRSGFYLGVGGLYGIEDFDNTGSLEFDNGPGFNFRLGYRFHPNIAVEAMGERVDAFDLDGSSNAEINTWTGTLNGKFFALTERFQPYGLVGLGAVRAKADGNAVINNSETDIAFRFGGGLDSYITESWVIELELSYVHPTGDVDDVNYLSLGGGIQYRF